MSSEVHKHIEESLVKNKNLYNAEVINFPNDKNIDQTRDSIKKNNKFWKISDESNSDQLKAVIGVCFMFGTLFLMGLYSNLT